MSISARLRMTRHSPTQSVHADESISEAGPSRLPEFSQLVDLTLKDVEVSDDNIYASDAPIDPTRQASAQIATKTENPAAVLRALLSRLPNKDESPIDHPDHQVLSERESDYDVETASAATSVAQSSVRNIFSRALREPGDTPVKDRRRRRSSSIGATDTENTPHILEARDIKGKRRSLSDDEADNVNKMSARTPARFAKTPRPLTQEFLRERFGKSLHSPVNRQDLTRENTSLHEIFGSSQISQPMATSTPQCSLLSLNQPRSHSNLLDKDSEMQNAFDALDSSADNLSHRSISPIPTLQIRSEPIDENIHDITDLNQTSLHATPRFNIKDLFTGAPSTVKGPRSKLTVYDNHDSLGEQSMSLSLPVGRMKLQSDVDYPRLTNDTNGGLHSITSSRPSPPLPDHSRPHTPIDVVRERERSWNKPQPVRYNRASHSSSIKPASPTQNRNQGLNNLVYAQEREVEWTFGSSPRRSPKHSFSTPRSKSPMQRPESPANPEHDRERNWNAPHPKWHDSSSLHTSKEESVKFDGHVRTNGSQRIGHDSSHTHLTPKLTRNPPSRPLSPLPAGTSPTSSVQADHYSRSRPQSTSPSPSSAAGRPATMNRTRRRPGTPTLTLSKALSMEQSNKLLGSERPDGTSRGPYPGHDCESDGLLLSADVRETDYSSSVDTPKSRLMEPPDMSEEEHQGPELVVTSKTLNDDATPPFRPLTTQNDTSLNVVPADTPVSPSTPPHRALKSVKFEPPPKTLPDLPTPSSSDESNNGSLMKMAKIPKLGTAHQNKWLQTPKPPGDWLATPQPAKFAEGVVLDWPETPDPNGREGRIPETSITSGRGITKTPKAPGGWATPAPTSLKSSEHDYSDDEGQRSQLLTPINSLSRGSNTPGVPGGWVNTPATRKSVLKVRFDPQTAGVKGESGLYSAPEPRDEDPDPSEFDGASQASGNLSLSSIRSPRRPKANIRVLDAFGREETLTSPKRESNASQCDIQILDAMGRDIREEQCKEEDAIDERTPLTRDMLLSRLRGGLNELAEDINVMDDNEDILTDGYSRIKELVTTSRQARRIREKLFAQSKKIVQPPVVKPSFRWKMWLGLIIAQTLLLCLVYRISLIYARNLFLSDYYDPFNPELYQFKSGHLPRLEPLSVWPRALLRDGDSWSTSMDIATYLSTLLSLDVVQSNAWAPT